MSWAKWEVSTDFLGLVSVLVVAKNDAELTGHCEGAVAEQCMERRDIGCERGRSRERG